MRGLLVISLLISSQLSAQWERDDSFGLNGLFSLDISPFERIERIQNDGQGGLWLFGYSGAFDLEGYYDQNGWLGRVDHTGTLMTDFGDGGWVGFDQPGLSFYQPEDLVVDDASNATVVARAFNTDISDSQPFCLARFLDNGNLDTTFGQDGFQTLEFLGWQNEPHDLLLVGEKTYVCGASFDTNYVHKEVPVIARLEASGDVDVSFGGGMLAFDVLSMQTFPIEGVSELLSRAPHDFGGVFHGMLPLPEERVLAFGSYSGPLGYECMATCLNSDGSVDTTFADGGLFTFSFDPGYNSWFQDAAFLPSGNISCAVHTEGSVQRNFYTLTLDVNGALIGQSEMDEVEEDLERVLTGPDGYVYGTGLMVEQANAATLNSSEYFGLTRLNASGSSPEGLNGGGLWMEHPDGMTPGHSICLELTESGAFLAGYILNPSEEQFSDFAILKLHDASLAIEQTSKVSMGCYPNPAQDHIWIKGHTGPMELWSGDGRLVKCWQMGPRSMSVSHLPIGAYVLKSQAGVSPFLISH